MLENKNEVVKSISIITNIDLTVRDIDDIMCTALEGGITYWCEKAFVVGNYLGVYAHEQIARGGLLRMKYSEDGETSVYKDLTLHNFIKGVKMWLENGGLAACVLSASGTTLDTCEIDAEDADCIIQYALFEEIIYG